MSHKAGNEKFATRIDDAGVVRRRRTADGGDAIAGDEDRPVRLRRSAGGVDHGDVGESERGGVGPGKDRQDEQDR